MSAPKRGIFRSRSLAIALTALVGTLASIGAFLWVLSWEHRVAEIDFQSRAKGFIETINTDLSDANTLLYTMAAYVDANEHAVSRNQFERFSHVLHGRVAGLRNIGWAPRVSLAQRPAFEGKTLAVFGIAGHDRIFERSRLGTFVTARDRPTYHPILYIETGQENRAGELRRLLGYDLTSEPLRAAAIARAVTTGLPAATPPLRLLAVKGAQGGVMAFMPVGDLRAPRSDRKRAAGVVLGAFGIGAMVENIVAKKNARKRASRS